jgi:hypothetical protein
LVALNEVTVSGVVPKFTVVAEVKLAPLMVRENAALPASTEVGLRLEIVDAGLVVNVEPAEVTPPVVTVTLAVPEVAIRLAGTCAVNCVGLTYVVVNAVLPHLAVVAEVKFAPEIVNVNAEPPAVAELGLKPLIVDAALMVNTAALEVPPGVVTVTLTVPAVAICAAVMAAVKAVAL